MDLRRLRYFVVVGEELNFHRAARQLGVSQPAVTKQISALESELGLDLFVREQQRISGLTAAGSSYLRDAQRLLSEFGKAADLAREIAEGRNGRFRLGVCDDAARKRFAQILLTFHSLFPAVDLDIFELSSPVVADALRRNDIDLGLVVAPIDSQALETESLWQEDWFVALPEAHPLSQSEQLTCADLATTDLMLAHPDFAPSAHEQVRAAFQAAGVKPRIVVRALRRATMMMLVAAGTGATFVPASVAARQSTGIVMRPFVAEPITLMAAYRAEDPAGLAMQFLRIAKHVLKTDPLVVTRDPSLAPPS